VTVSTIDKNLLERCLRREPRSWEDFVDRFLGLVIHVINHTAGLRSIRLSHQDREDLAADVFLAVLDDDFAILRRFRGESSLATYLTVIARRVVVRELLLRRRPSALHESTRDTVEDERTNGDSVQQRISDRDEIERLIRELTGPEAAVVRMYHLDGASYKEISRKIGIPENSVGPTLSRARDKLRQLSRRRASA
jgi:RNA polymerase sigma-70 factor (ECF subfamily)